MATNSPRILGIDPGTRHMGVGVLEHRRLLHTGVVRFERGLPPDAVLRETRLALLQLIDRYHPAVLAHEKTFWVRSKRTALLQVQEAEIKRLGELRGLTVVGYAPSHVRKLLCGDGHATKAQVADFLVRRFPELRRHRRRHGFPLYWLHMFDALAVAVVCAERMGASEGDRSPARRAA